MTDTSHGASAGAPAHGRVRSEEDRISSGKVIAVGVGALVVFFLASFVTLSYLRVQEGERPLLPVPPEIGQSKIGLVEQQLFESASLGAAARALVEANRGAKDRDARRSRLESYGWVDRKAGVVRIPIARAMELSAQGARPRAGAPGAAAGEAQP